MTDSQFRNYVEDLLKDPFFANFPYKDSVRLLLAMTHVGVNDGTLAKFTGLNRDKFVRPRIKRLRESGVLGKGSLDCSWGGEEGPVALLCDALVAEGLVQRLLDETA